MEDKKTGFASRGMFLFNLLFSGALAGIGLTLFFISCSTGIPAQGSVQAEERPGVGTVDVYSLQQSFRNVARTALPSVVAVKVVEKPQTASRSRVNPFGEDFPFEFFFGPQQRKAPGQPQAPEVIPEPQRTGYGSGFIVRTEGSKVYVLTNHHVAGNAEKITVAFEDEKEFQATLVGSDPRKDLALLSFEAPGQNYKPLPLADSNTLEVGDIVMAVGNPLTFGFSVTQGIVSAVGRQRDLTGRQVGPNGSIGSYIQTDASINQGNSGGPLLNLKGEVVGINTWIATPDGGNIGLGFSVPINNAKKAVEDFISQGKVVYGWLGVNIGTLDRERDKDLLKDLKLENERGAFVVNVYRNSPADKAGINPGDLIVSVNGKNVKDSTELTLMVGDIPAGQSGDFVLVREGRRITLKVTIEERLQEDKIAEQSNLLWPGVSVTPLSALNDQGKKSLKLGDQIRGVVITDVVSGGAAEIAGLRRGDVLTQINGKPVVSLADFYRLLSTARGEVKLSFHRQGVDLSIGITR